MHFSPGLNLGWCFISLRQQQVILCFFKGRWKPGRVKRSSTAWIPSRTQREIMAIEVIKCGHFILITCDYLCYFFIRLLSCKISLIALFILYIVLAIVMSRLVLSSYRKTPGDQFEDNLAFVGTAKSQLV